MSIVQAQILRLGMGEDPSSERCCEEKFLEEIHRKFQGLDVAKSSPAQVFPCSGPEFFQVLAGIHDPVAQRIEPDIEELQS